MLRHRPQLRSGTMRALRRAAAGTPVAGKRPGFLHVLEKVGGIHTRWWQRCWRRQERMWRPRAAQSGPEQAGHAQSRRSLPRGVAAERLCAPGRCDGRPAARLFTPAASAQRRECCGSAQREAAARRLPRALAALRAWNGGRSVCGYCRRDGARARGSAVTTPCASGVRLRTGAQRGVTCFS